MVIGARFDACCKMPCQKARHTVYSPYKNGSEDEQVKPRVVKSRAARLIVYPNLIICHMSVTTESRDQVKPHAILIINVYILYIVYVATAL